MRMGGGGSNLWSIWQTGRWDWFIGKIFSFFKRKSPLGRFGECPLLMEERTMSIRGLRSAFDPYATSAEAAYSAGRGLLYLITDKLLVEKTC